MIANRTAFVFPVGTNTSVSPEIDERVDVRIDGIRRNVQHVMKEDVRVDRAHEEPRRRARIVDADHAGGGGAAEVVFDDLDAAARRAVWILRQRPRVHEDGDVLREDLPRERDELLGNAAQHVARIGRRGVDRRQLDDERRRLRRKMHGRGEQRVLRRDVAQDGCGRDLQLAGDVGKRGGVEAFCSEDALGDGEQLVPADGGRASHL